MTFHESVRGAIESIITRHKITDIEWRDKMIKEAIRKNNTYLENDSQIENLRYEEKTYLE